MSASRFTALLRGVNVGAGNRVPMATFREILEALGYRDVSTLLNSGNAVFETRNKPTQQLATAIHRKLQTELDVDVPVIVKSSDEFRQIVAECPFELAEADHSRTLVAFTQSQEALATLEPIVKLAAGRDRFVVGRHAAYFSCPDGVLKSKAGEALLGRAGRAATTRNWGTTLKLLQLVSTPKGKVS